MKFTIVINQLALTKMGMKGKVKANHIAVLDVIQSMHSSKFQKKIVGEETYVKTFYKVIADELEFFDLSQHRVKQLVVELEAIGFIKRGEDCATERCLWVALTDLFYQYQTSVFTPDQPDNKLSEVGKEINGGVGKKTIGNQDTNNQTTNNKYSAFQNLLDLYPSEQFKELVMLFIDHRNQSKKKLTPASTKLIVNKLTEFGEENSIVALTNAVEKGWSSVFMPKPEEVKQVNTIGITPHYQDPKAIEVYNKLKAKGFRNCTPKEVEWCFDFQRTDPAREHNISRNELLINRDDPKTYGEDDAYWQQRSQQSAQNRRQFTIPPLA